MLNTLAREHAQFKHAGLPARPTHTQLNVPKVKPTLAAIQATMGAPHNAQ